MQQVKRSRLLTTGDFIIRHFPDSNEWRCWLVGANEPYTDIIGRGKFPIPAIQDWNDQAVEAKRKLANEDKSSQPKKASRGWLR